MGEPQTFTDVQPIQAMQSFTDVQPINSPASGMRLSNPSTIPNARIRNMPNPVDPSWGPGRALYEGAKTGVTLASIPAAVAATPTQLVAGVAGGTVGAAAGKQIAKSAGAGEFGQEVGGDVGGLAGGVVAGGAAGWARAKAQAIYDALPEVVQKELIGVVSPRVKNALHVLDALNSAKAAAPAAPPVNAGAPLPANPLPEQINPALISPARTLPGMNSPEVIRPPAAIRPSPAQPIPARSGLALAGEVAPTKTLADLDGTPSGAGIPRTLSGESVLREELTKQPNNILLKLAKSRGVNVSQESLLKPSNSVNNRIINKIVDDFNPDELDEIRSQRIGIDRGGRHDFGDIGKEANQTISLQTYFPELKIPLAQQLRTMKSIATAGQPRYAPLSDLAGNIKQSAAAASEGKPMATSAPPEDLTATWSKELKRVRKLKRASQTATAASD